MSIKKYTGTITNIIDLSETSKEVNIKLDEPMDFIPGSFVNVFMDIDGVNIRRAYSIASSSLDRMNISLAIRLSPGGTMTKIFWSEDMKGKVINLMGPLGLNTVDKMSHQKIYLFAFGIGAGVVKSISHYFLNVKQVQELVIVTGSRTEEEIIYKEYFNQIANDFGNVIVAHVVSRAQSNEGLLKGYIQDHIDGYNFNDSDVYICGQVKACEELISKIKSMNPVDCNYYIEAFH